MHLFVKFAALPFFGDILQRAFLDIPKEIPILDTCEIRLQLIIRHCHDLTKHQFLRGFRIE